MVEAHSDSLRHGGACHYGCGGVVCYSRRTEPTTSAMPVISSSGMSKGGYSLLSETAVRQFLCCEGMSRLTIMPCSRVAITWHLFHCRNLRS